MDSFTVQKKSFLKDILIPLQLLNIQEAGLVIDATDIYTIATKGQNDCSFYGSSSLVVSNFEGKLNFADIFLLRKVIDMLNTDLITFKINKNNVVLNDDSGKLQFKIYLVNDAAIKNSPAKKEHFLNFVSDIDLSLNKNELDQLLKLKTLAISSKALYINKVDSGVEFLFTDKTKTYVDEFRKTFDKDVSNLDPLIINSEVLEWFGKDIDTLKILHNKNKKTYLIFNIDRKYYLVSQLEK